MSKHLRILSKYLNISVGAVFLLSGTLKAADAARFAQLLSEYGIWWLPYFAPAVIVAETAAGLWLISGFRCRRAAVSASAMIAFFTAIYTFGLLSEGIEECGCFGDTGLLSSTPAALYLRNAVMMCMLLPGSLAHGDTDSRPTTPAWVIAASATAICAFVSGYTFRIPKSAIRHKEPEAVAVSDSPLTEFIHTDPDSTCIVFTFSYTCPHCLNSIANLKEYARTGAAGRVIALSSGDSAAEQRFREAFAPNFEIQNHGRELLKVTRNFPCTFFIEGDSIRRTIRGTLPAPQLTVARPNRE